MSEDRSENLTQPRTSKPRETFSLPERVFAWLGIVLVSGLFWQAGSAWISLAAFSCLLSYLTAVRWSESGTPARIVINFCASAVIYGGSGVVIESLRLPLHHHQLLEWDRWLFGETPAVALQQRLPWWMNDCLSCGYLSYHVYLFWMMVWVIRQPDSVSATCSRTVFTAFGAGFCGYFLFPAAGPEVAFPELFPVGLEGGWPTRLNQAIVGNFAAKYDSFPSLHIFITVGMMACDWRYQSSRLMVMLLPSLLMVASTILLRLHYAVDLLVSAILVVPFLWLMSFPKTPEP